MKVEFDFVPVLDAITDTIMQAQKKTEEHQVELMKKYFHEDGTPVIQTVNVAGEKGKEKVKVPLMSMIPPTAVQMKEVSLRLKVPVIKLVEELSEASGDETKSESTTGKTVIDKDYMADLHITYEGVSAPLAFQKITEILANSI